MGGKGKASGVGAIALVMVLAMVLLNACGGGENGSSGAGEGPSATEQAAVATALRGYLETNAATDPEKKCSFLSKERVEGLKKLGQLPSIKLKACPEILAALEEEGFVSRVAVRSIRSTSFGQDDATVTFVGKEKGAAGNEKELLRMKLVDEPGGWKVTALGPESASSG